MRSNAAKEDTEELILDAADRLLARYGYRKMTIDDLAAEVGIGKAGEVRTFENHRGLFRTQIADLLRQPEFDALGGHRESLDPIDHERTEQQQHTG